MRLHYRDLNPGAFLSFEVLASLSTGCGPSQSRAYGWPDVADWGTECLSDLCKENREGSKPLLLDFAFAKRVFSIGENEFHLVTPEDDFLSVPSRPRC